MIRGAFARCREFDERSADFTPPTETLDFRNSCGNPAITAKQKKDC